MMYDGRYMVDHIEIIFCRIPLLTGSFDPPVILRGKIMK